MVLVVCCMRTFLLQSVVVVGLAAGCAGSGQVTYSADYQAPRLVEISPGVQVIADYDEPIFYSDDYYWRNEGGVWYRSKRHTSGWARAELVPPRIQTIERPSMYIHYRGEVAVPESRHDMHEDAEEHHKQIKEERKEAKEARKEAKEERKEAKERRKDAEEAREHEH